MGRHTGRPVAVVEALSLVVRPMRIVSLLPSATEIVCALGLEDDLVGVTFECDYPEAARSKTVVSDTTLPSGLNPSEIDQAVSERIDDGLSIYTLHEDALRGLDPDLVLTQDLCSVCAVDVSDVNGALQHLGCRAEVLTLDPKRLAEVLASIETVGAATGTPAVARDVAAALDRRLDQVAATVGPHRPRVFVLEWTDPPYNAGHWVPDMVAAAGGEALLATAGEYSTPIEWDAIAASAPDVVVVAPCGYDLAATRSLVDGDAGLRAHLAGLPSPPLGVWAVDASAYFARPGPRLVDGVEILAGILHPNTCAPPGADQAAIVGAVTPDRG